MTYVMSDIHGEKERFDMMLHKIEFSSTDTLYILGDVIDCFPYGLDILHEIMESPNMQLLMGNHELMCLETFRDNNDPTIRRTWLNNGGECTYNELVNISETERNKILDFLAALPDHMDLRIKWKKYHLVHGFPAKDTESRVWNRPKMSTHNPFPDKKKVIIGHTPVFYLTGNSAKDLVFRELRGEDVGESHFEIAHAKGFIDIDCGCGTAFPSRRLACLRLEDMAEFYI